MYLKEVYQNLPRLFGLLDRNIMSKTYGCFDRNYWHYKITDFPCARSQEAVLTLALIYKLKSSELLLEFINASLNFWCGIQNKNGSFNEWYPNENSFAGTVFSSYAVSETLLILKKKDIKIINHLEKSAKYLINKHEYRVLNQECGSVILFYNMYLLTKKEEYKKEAKKRVYIILKKQNEEGWFDEYNGADIGYLSLAIDYLAKYYKKTKDKNVLKAIKKAENFLKYFLHPDYSVGGTYGSRNTEYLIPDGFEIIESNISNFILEGIKRKSIVSLTNLDDRYLSYNAYTYLQAYLNFKPKKQEKYMFEEEPFKKYFKKANLYIVNNEKYYFILNTKKTSFYYFDKANKTASYDSGIEAEGLISCNANAIFRKNKIMLTGYMHKIPNKNINPLKTILIRIFQITIGKNESISRFVKEKLRDSMITEFKKINIKFRREILFNKDKILITNNLNKPLKTITGKKSSYTYVPSSRF